MKKLPKLSLVLAGLLGVTLGLAAEDPLEKGWANPPTSARLRAYWWWLNGQVTKAAITRDLEEMKAKGFGGALICDAGGAEQDGNDRVPPGPTFFTPEWRELYKHTLREAERLGLEMSLNIQSGWNLGGPMVSADDAAKKLVWSEMRIQGGSNVSLKLPVPRSRDGYYRDLFVVAYPVKAAQAQKKVFLGVKASSEQSGHVARLMTDGDAETFWVSGNDKPGEGPSRERPLWVQLEFAQSIPVDRIQVLPRPGYGPQECELQMSEDGKNFRPVKSFSAAEREVTSVDCAGEKRKFIRLMMLGAYDPRYPNTPRNAQICELTVWSKNMAMTAGAAARRPIQNWEQKAMHRALHFSAPDTTPLLRDVPAEAGEEDARMAEVVDVTSRLKPDGTLTWDAPAGSWEVLRFGCTIGDHSRVSTSSDGWKGYALDVLDAGAFQRYWDAVVEPLIQDAGPRAGRTLKYLHTDSWEVEAINWTPTLREEFRKRRGYDLLPYWPVIAGRIVESRPISNRFLHDFRKTLGDLAIDNHYRLFRDGAHRHGMQMHPESGGPHAVPIDAQRCLGWNDVPMSEFWAWSWRHRVGDSNRFFVKQPASAAHTSGRRLVAAEGFTTIGPHWQETLWDNLKPSFDHAACEGLNLLVWHAFVCSPAEMGMPGIQYFAGTHFNPHSTWWAKSESFLSYINHCQFMLQQGLFVADVCYYYGDHVPNFAQLKRTDPAGVLPGYDYDVVTEETILERMSVSGGLLALPDGMTYRALVLPKHARISLPVLKKLKVLSQGGATIIGPRPMEATGLSDFPRSDLSVLQLAEELWGRSGPANVISGKSAREVLLAKGIKPDFEYTSQNAQAGIDYIHRRDGDTDIYFVANRSNQWEKITCRFRVSGKQPELWDSVTGKRANAGNYNMEGPHTTVPLELPPYGSHFVVFRKPGANAGANRQPNQLVLTARQELKGVWKVSFDPKWGGPATAVDFPELVSWTDRPESEIKFYSGTATYTFTFDLPEALRGKPVWLDLGKVRELAEVRVNGKSLGVLWAPPFRVEITEVVKATGNQLEIELVNFWPNRIIGDQFLPPDKRYTRTNIRKLTKETALMPSGLFGPVKLLTAQ